MRLQIERQRGVGARQCRGKQTEEGAGSRGTSYVLLLVLNLQVHDIGETCEIDLNQKATVTHKCTGIHQPELTSKACFNVEWKDNHLPDVKCLWSMTGQNTLTGLTQLTTDGSASHRPADLHRRAPRSRVGQFHVTMDGIEQRDSATHRLSESQREH